jgi:hypothetical protein
VNTEFSLKKVVVFLLLGVALLAIPITVYVAQRQQNTQSNASVVSDTTVIAMVNGQQITKFNVKKVAQEQYEKGAVDSQALNDSLKAIIERRLLDSESTSRGITINPSDIQVRMDDEGLTNTQAKYDLLREKVAQVVAKNWQVYVIGFWVPPSDQQANMTADEKTTAAKQLTDGLKALDEAETLMSGDKSALEIAQSLIKKYPSLEPVLGVNGYFVAQAEKANELSQLENPRTYYYQSASVGQPLFDAIYSLNTAGEVKKALSDKDSGGNVVKLINSNTNASFNTYEEWLANKKQSSVQILSSL